MVTSQLPAAYQGPDCAASLYLNASVCSSAGFQMDDTRRVIQAVESLYDDQLKPYSRILLKRLDEHAEQLGLASFPSTDPHRLRAVCESCEFLVIEQEKGVEWSVLLRHRHASFVDVYSPADIYPAELWQEAQRYLESLSDTEMVLPGGRYSCAQTLRARHLSFLAGRTLGEVCHIVQLAISQKKLLGYLRGAVVPYGRSQSMVKDRCAQLQSPESVSSSGLADWETMRLFLREICSTLQPGVDSIPLSNLKRLFRHRFRKELSETALGHSKLSDLLQDPRVHDLVSLQLQGHSYVVTSVATTFAYKGNAVPNAHSERNTLRDRAGWIKPLSLENTSMPQASVQDRTLVANVPPPPAVLPPYVEPVAELSLPPSILTSCGDSRCVARKESNCFEHASGPETASNNASAHDMRGRPLLTPCTLASMGFMVSNTFIHAYLPPPTPLNRSARRSRSDRKSVV